MWKWWVRLVNILVNINNWPCCPLEALLCNAEKEILYFNLKTDRNVWICNLIIWIYSMWCNKKEALYLKATPYNHPDNVEISILQLQTWHWLNCDFSHMLADVNDCAGAQLTASGSVSSSGWSGGVHFCISFNSRGYLTKRLRGRSRKFHRSSFLLNEDSWHRRRKCSTLFSCFFWSSKALAPTWLQQYVTYASRQGNCRETWDECAAVRRWSQGEERWKHEDRA